MSFIWGHIWDLSEIPYRTHTGISFEVHKQDCFKNYSEVPPRILPGVPIRERVRSIVLSGILHGYSSGITLIEFVPGSFQEFHQKFIPGFHQGAPPRISLGIL